MMPIRLLVQSLVCVAFLAVVLTAGRVAEGEARLRAQVLLVDEMKGRMSRQVAERAKSERSWMVERACYQEWFDKVAVPRETILRYARIDAVKSTRRGESYPLDRCYARASLDRDGWHVACGFDECTNPPPEHVHYVIDPITAKVLSRRVERDPPRSPSGP